MLQFFERGYRLWTCLVLKGRTWVHLVVSCFLLLDFCHVVSFYFCLLCVWCFQRPLYADKQQLPVDASFCCSCLRPCFRRLSCTCSAQLVQLIILVISCGLQSHQARVYFDELTDGSAGERSHKKGRFLPKCWMMRLTAVLLWLASKTLCEDDSTILNVACS